MATKTGRRDETLPTVTDYITKIIENCPLSQVEIADQLGYTRPNIISMWKKGATAVPPEKIEKLAEICGADPRHAMRVLLNSYYPVLLKSIERHFGYSLSRGEQDVLQFCRDKFESRDIILTKAMECAITSSAVL